MDKPTWNFTEKPGTSIEDAIQEILEGTGGSGIYVRDDGHLVDYEGRKVGPSATLPADAVIHEVTVTDGVARLVWSIPEGED